MLDTTSMIHQIVSRCYAPCAGAESGIISEAEVARSSTCFTQEPRPVCRQMLKHHNNPAGAAHAWLTTGTLCPDLEVLSLSIAAIWVHSKNVIMLQYHLVMVMKSSNFKTGIQPQQLWGRLRHFAARTDLVKN